MQSVSQPLLMLMELLAAEARQQGSHALARAQLQLVKPTAVHTTTRCLRAAWWRPHRERPGGQVESCYTTRPWRENALLFVQRRPGFLWCCGRTNHLPPAGQPPRRPRASQSPPSLPPSHSSHAATQDARPRTCPAHALLQRQNCRRPARPASRRCPGGRHATPALLLICLLAASLAAVRSWMGGTDGRPNSSSTTATSLKTRPRTTTRQARSAPSAAHTERALDLADRRLMPASRNAMALTPVPPSAAAAASQARAASAEPIRAAPPLPPQTHAHSAAAPTYPGWQAGRRPSAMAAAALHHARRC